MPDRILFPADETGLIERIRRGDRKALLALFDGNRKPIVSLITRNGGTEDDAEDVLQDAVVVLWERIRIGKFEQTAAVGTFLYAVARRLWLQQLARKRRHQTDETDPDDLPGDESYPEDLLVREENDAAVEGALIRLDPTCRSLLILFYWERSSMEEIASFMGFANAQTMKAKKYQCKEKLRRLLKELDHDR